MWRDVANNLENYRSYPRVVGETGGKDFIVAHPDCDEAALIVALLRGSFEFQGQKCSASSRAYIPKSVWNNIKDEYIVEVGKITIGDPRDFTNLSAVIDKKSFDNISGYIERAKASPDCEIVTGGGYDGSKGYFVEPTTIVCSDPHYESMSEEIFGPVLSIHVYEDDEFEEILKTCDETSEYALTGSIFATKREDILTAMNAPRYSAGNFYINDKPTGAVVGQQPFGGARGSGTKTTRLAHPSIFALGISSFNQGNLRTAAFMGLWFPKRVNRLAFASVDSIKRINQYSRFIPLTNQGNNPPSKSEKWRRYQS